MYRSLSQNWRRRELTSESLLHHDRESRKFLDDYLQVIGKEVEQNSKQIPHGISDRLLSYIADTRNLRIAWDVMSESGGKAPGKRTSTTLPRTDKTRASCTGCVELFAFCCFMATFFIY